MTVASLYSVSLSPAQVAIPALHVVLLRVARVPGCGAAINRFEEGHFISAIPFILFFLYINNKS
jgi:hypothetical protein